jgi:hypothetical protein
VQLSVRWAGGDYATLGQSRKVIGEAVVDVAVVRLIGSDDKHPVARGRTAAQSQ